MFASLRTSKMTKDENLSSICKSFNVNEEYLSALRTESYTEFFSQAQLLASNPSATPISFHNVMEMLVEPKQDAVPSILETMVLPTALSDLKHLMLSYFDTSAEASKICSHLLRSINQTHTNYQYIKRAIDSFDDHSPEELKLAISELDSFTLLGNPFSNTNQHEFKLIQDRYTTILHHLKSKRKKVARKIKLIKCIKKAFGVCLTVACSVVALVAIGIAVHSLTGLLVGPAILGISPLHLKKKFSNLRFFRSSFLQRLGEKLDAAAKGMYILNRDFDTMSRLVARLHNEVEHTKEMIRFCLGRKEDKFPLREVVKELKKSGVGVKWQVEELEEHVCLCLVTINRARVLVINEMSAP